jgi:hypothetical protein
MLCIIENFTPIYLLDLQRNAPPGVAHNDRIYIASYIDVVCF